MVIQVYDTSNDDKLRIVFLLNANLFNENKLNRYVRFTPASNVDNVLTSILKRPHTFAKNILHFYHLSIFILKFLSD